MTYGYNEMSLNYQIRCCCTTRRKGNSTMRYSVWVRADKVQVFLLFITCGGSKHISIVVDGYSKPSKTKCVLLVFSLVVSGLLYFTIIQQISKQGFIQTVNIQSIIRSIKMGSTNDTIGIKSDNSKESMRYRQQRDDLSRHLNMVLQVYGRVNCQQLAALQAAGIDIDSRVSENGGWCGRTSNNDNGDHKWDESFSIALSAFLKGKTVASFGDGPGKYKNHLDSIAQVKMYTAYDGAPFCENDTRGFVKFLDLTSPQYGLEAYDWVVSVEVGEHIPAKFEDIYLDNVVRHAREGIVLSWAVPGQDGLSHVNNKRLNDVILQLKRRGFKIDVKAGRPLRAAATYSWLRENIHVYKRIDQKSFVEGDV